jgi:hypothetical protein
VDVRAAVAGLACHGICAPRLILRTGRHMPRQSSRSLGCAVAARRQLPLLPPKAAGSAAAADPSASLRGGLVRVAAVGRARAECRLRREFIGCPILAPLSAGRRVWLFGTFNVFRLRRRATNNPVLASWPAVSVASSSDIEPSCCVPPKSAAPRATAMRRVRA